MRCRVESPLSRRAPALTPAPRPPCRSSVLSKSFLEPLADFYRDSMSMLDKAHKPDQKGERAPPAHARRTPGAARQRTSTFAVAQCMRVAVARAPAPRVLREAPVSVSKARTHFPHDHVCHVAEYLSVLSSTGLGLLIMGGLGYVVKLLHYPVKEILVGKMAS